MSKPLAKQLADLQDYTTQCTRCPRLVDWRQDVARTKRKQFMDDDYWGKPVPAWGDPSAELVIIGLAPAAHGANRTGRMFTGDRSGDWLYRALHKAGFANQPTSTGKDDGLVLQNCWISAAARCAPPLNKLTADELANCRSYLAEEIPLLPKAKVILCLGGVALTALWNTLKHHDTLRAHVLGADVALPKKPAFGHGILTPLSQQFTLALSYHPSQQNTFTKRLTEPMFDKLFTDINAHLRQRV